MKYLLFGTFIVFTLLRAFEGHFDPALNDFALSLGQLWSFLTVCGYGAYILYNNR